MTVFFKYAAAVAALAGAAIGTSAFAQGDAAKQSFVRNGVEYTYTVEAEGEGQVLRGSANHGAEPFRLFVRDDVVTGTFDNHPVRFKLEQVKAAALAAND
ncbi:hypothetical protein [Novosphingobium sp. 9]|uniref:hypothetical protein n=1 Tax=Novosphingobium sp. 9 TaxID=2025349 RepID=UPI0021B583FF|nr:hypothetical protein [Novosphingobium sp. 9]